MERRKELEMSEKTGILGQVDIKIKDSNDRGIHSIFIVFYADHK